MRPISLLLLLLLAACGGSGNDPAGPGDPLPEAPRPLVYAYMNRLPQPDDLSAVSEAGGRAIAVGRAGAVVIREPGATDWRRVQAPTGSNLFAVKMIDALTVLAAGADGTWLSRDGGSNWKLVDSTGSMFEIAFRNGLALVGGSNGIIFSADLENWEVANDSPTGVRDIGFAGDGVIWAMGTLEMHRSTDGGKNWVKFIEGSSFHAFAFAEENFGALGRGNFEVLGTTNGTTFTKVQDLPTSVVDIDFKTSALGILVTRLGHVYTSDSRGKAWAFQMQLDAEQRPADIELTSDGEVLVVGSEGLIAESGGGITTISEISSGFGTDLHDVAFGNLLEGLASEEAVDVPLFRTTDGGRSWEEIPSPVRMPRALAFHSDEFALVLDRDGAVFRSDDLGDTWTDTGASSESFMTSLFIADRETWLSGGNRFIARTADSGTNWSLAPVEISVRGMDRFPGTDVVLAVGSGLIRSEDRGATWSGPSGEIVTGNEVVCVDDQIAITVNNSIYRSTDQGLTWVEVFDSSDEFYAVTFIDKLHGIVVGDDGMLLETLDAGLTWTEVRITGMPLLDVTTRGPQATGVLIVGEDGVVIAGADPLE